MTTLGNSKCWNCGSMKYYNTISTEHCPDCGIRCDYHGGGINEAYQSAMDRQHYKEKLREEEEMERHYEETYGINYRGEPV